MDVFVLGATGYIGSVVAERLQGAGHRVRGLARSEASVATLAARGVEPVWGSLETGGVLAEAARKADAMVHAAFAMDGHDFDAATAIESSAVRALTEAIAGTGKRLLFTSGTGILGDTGDRVFMEDTPIDLPPTDDDGPLAAIRERLATERAVLVAGGVVLRPPNVYGRADGNSVLTPLRMAACRLRAVPYPDGAGDRLWSFVHVEDLADLYLLALERSGPGELYHAGAQSGLRTRDIAEAASRGMGLDGRTVELPIPELGEALGAPPLAYYWASNSQSSAGKARRLLGWNPAHTDLLADLRADPVG